MTKRIASVSTMLSTISKRFSSFYFSKLSFD